MSEQTEQQDSPKCGRCSNVILDGELVVRDHGNWLHLRCRRIMASSDRVRESKVLNLESRKFIESSKLRIEESRRRHLLQVAEWIIATAQRHAYCFPCLAVHLRVMEHEVRSAGQLLVRGRFIRDRRVCYSRGRMDDVLVPRD